MAEEKKQESLKEGDIKAFDMESYIKNRWYSQRSYFSKKSQENQKYFIRCQKLVLYLSAVLVFLLSIDFEALLGWENRWINVICAGISAAIVIITGIDRLRQYNSEWIKSRKYTERLKTEICKYLYGVEPYTVPEVEDEKEAKSEESADESDNKTEPIEISERTKLLIEKINSIIEKCKDSDVKLPYMEMKTEIANYVAGSKDFAEKKCKLSSKDKAFVNRLNSILDGYLKVLEGQNINGRIKNEICDFFTVNGAYMTEQKHEPKLKISKNDRLFVTRVEEIIANDVEDFVNTKNKLADFDAQIEQLIEKKFPKK